MDYCSWFTVEERDIVTSISDGALVRTVMKGWESHHPDGNYARKTRRTGGNEVVTYFLCSKRTPAVVWRGDKPGKWEVNFLTNLASPPGAAESVTNQYFAVCHGVKPSGDWEILTRKFAYDIIPDKDEGVADALYIDRPDEVMRLAAARRGPGARSDQGAVPGMATGIDQELNQGFGQTKTPGSSQRR
ncbi:hypothetical protein [Methylobacterium indicum]|nr:hypothetical protein [Methylobacterium indicum]